MLLFELPDTTRILDECAFWDIYYEHCSYFTAGSLARLFRQAGFAVDDLYRVYDDQYLVIEARPAGGKSPGPLAIEEPVAEARRRVVAFAPPSRPASPSYAERSMNGTTTTNASCSGARARRRWPI